MSPEPLTDRLTSSILLEELRRKMCGANFDEGANMDPQGRAYTDGWEARLSLIDCCHTGHPPEWDIGWFDADAAIKCGRVKE